MQSVDGVMGSLSPEAFLKLFVTQVQHQDPMEPMDPSRLTSELAQLSSVQQLSQLNENFQDAMRGEQLNVGRQLIGSRVTYVFGDAAGEGVVDAVAVQDGRVGVVVNDGFVPLSDIRSITENMV